MGMTWEVKGEVWKDVRRGVKSVGKFGGVGKVVRKCVGCRGRCGKCVGVWIGVEKHGKVWVSVFGV